MNPEVIVDAYEPGLHTVRDSAGRVRDAKTYTDQSCVQICPSRGEVTVKCLSTWFNLMAPMNQQFVRLWASGYEVGDAYTVMLEQVMETPLADFQYVLTMEEDNIPPPDGLIRLMEAMQAFPQFSAIGGLYWCKGDGGQPMIYGNHRETPLNFRPQPPQFGEDGEGVVQECVGLGMGFTLFRMSLFKDPKVARPWFETIQRVEANGAIRSYTQDLAFFEKAHNAGHRFACHTGVRVGHYEKETGIVW